MPELLTAEQMRALEREAMARGNATGLDLMERAGRGVVDAIFSEWPDLAASSFKAVVLCGPGNNGGDGFVIARLLAGLGWTADVFLYGDPEKLPPDARVNYERWCAMGAVRGLDAAAGADPADLVVDALFGTGLTRPLGDTLATEQERPRFDARGAPARRVAVDVPSGLCSDSGRILGGEARAGVRMAVDLTVTFERRKLGHVLADGPALCGACRVVPLGIRHGAYAAFANDRTISMDVAPPGRWLSKAGHHKYDHGHALILSGGPGKGGAARLAARGALRIGAGLVTLGCPPDALFENASQLNAVMTRPVHDADALLRVLDDPRINALCLGPGLGLGEDARGLVLATLRAGRPTVLDADGLTAFERNTHALFAALHDNVVLTPHMGEFRRLFPDLAEKLAAPAETGPAYSKVDAARAAASRAGCSILLKGPDTVIADEMGETAIAASVYDQAAPWLATAGAGDVLAGFIAGLLARRFDPMSAASTAAWLHAECARSFGPGLIAEDLPEELPRVLRALGF